MKNLACRLGWINTMAKCLASSQSEHGWRAPLNGLSYLLEPPGRTFQKLSERGRLCPHFEPAMHLTPNFKVEGYT
jgi:hypothetical protein